MFKTERNQNNNNVLSNVDFQHGKWASGIQYCIKGHYIGLDVFGFLKIL